MKLFNSYIKTIALAFSALWATSCVHDDKFDAPNLEEYQCADLSNDTNLQLISLEDTKKLYTGSETYQFPENSNLYIEGYVSSSDEAGNIYKTLFIQDKPENPTQGFVISVDAVSTYVNFPQGAKIYVKLAGLSLGEYGGVVQLGVKTGTETRVTSVSRIPEKSIASHILRSCSERATIIPKVMTLAEVRNSEALVGALIQINDAEFHSSVLCTQYASEGNNIAKGLTDATHSAATTIVAYNSGYSSFANKTLPSGKGTFVGVLSRYNTTWQFLIVKDSDLNMNGDRRDGKVAPCAPDANATKMTVAQVKSLLNGTATEITENATLTGKITANDETGNIYRAFYIEDETGGIKVNVNNTTLHQDKRFQVGRTLTINLKDLYIFNVNDELQLGKNNQYKQVETADMYLHFFANDLPISVIPATERTISSLTLADVGRRIKLKNLQFINEDLGKNYADGTAATNRTLEDCNGNTIILRTNGRANFGNSNESLVANAIEIDPGKGDVYAILSIYKGEYQLLITKLKDIDLDHPRCDGTLPTKENAVTIFDEGFANLDQWDAVNVSGTETWGTANFGNPRPSAIMDGKRKANEDWLVMKSPVSLAGYTDGYLIFETDGRYEGATLEVFVTDNYTGTPSTTNWTKLNANIDTDLKNFAGFVSSGKISLKSFIGKNVTIAFKYVSTAGNSTTWEIDNVKINVMK